MNLTANDSGTGDRDDSPFVYGIHMSLEGGTEDHTPRPTSLPRELIAKMKEEAFGDESSTLVRREPDSSSIIAEPQLRAWLTRTDDL